MSSSIEVGVLQRKKVSELNHEIFKKGKEIFDDPENMGLSHMGWQGLGAFVDWLEANYKMERR